MTGINAKRNSVSAPRTATCCGLTLSAAIQHEKRLDDNPSATTPETVIIGDRGLRLQAANIAHKTASTVYTLFIIYPQNLRQDDNQPPYPQATSRQAEDHAGKCAQEDCELLRA